MKRSVHTVCRAVICLQHMEVVLLSRWIILANKMVHGESRMCIVFNYEVNTFEYLITYSMEQSPS